MSGHRRLATICSLNAPSVRKLTSLSQSSRSHCGRSPLSETLSCHEKLKVCRAHIWSFVKLQYNKHNCYSGRCVSILFATYKQWHKMCFFWSCGSIIKYFGLRGKKKQGNGDNFKMVTSIICAECQKFYDTQSVMRSEGHVARMRYKINVCEVMVRKRQGKRTYEELRHRWYNIKISLNECKKGVD